MSDLTPTPFTPAGLASALRQMRDEVYEVNVANGWFDEDRTFGDDVALAHTEVSEEMEAFREGLVGDWLSWKLPVRVDLDVADPECYVDTKVSVRFEAGTPEADMMADHHGPGKPEGIGSEAADQLIRLLDHCKRHNIDLGIEFVRKLAYNRTRGYKHGGKIL